MFNKPISKLLPPVKYFAPYGTLPKEGYKQAPRHKYRRTEVHTTFVSEQLPSCLTYCIQSFTQIIDLK